MPGSEQLLTKKIWMQNKDHPDAAVLSPPSVELSSEPGTARAPQPECRPASTPGTACWGCPPSLGQRSPPTRHLWAGSGRSYCTGTKAQFSCSVVSDAL